MRFIFITLCLLLYMVKSQAQPGCTDPQALNFDPSATLNDGSCTYPFTLYPPPQIAQLPAALDECSGLAFFSNRLWMHMDAGNLAQLYVIDTLTGALLQTVTIPAAVNNDWEDLAMDDEHLYIGDFGNNAGNRTDLKILRVKKTALTGGVPIFETIAFSFSDQTDFTPAYNANNYDCEAFFFWNDSLHLFSKNWLDFKTRHYVLPAEPGTHVAQLRDSFEVQGQITGADISPDGKAVLLGYNTSTSEAFLWLLFDFPGNRFFAGNKRKISLGSALFVSQVEGIAFRGNSAGYICSERFSALPQKLLSFDIRQWTENPVTTHHAALPLAATVSPNPFGDAVWITFAALPVGNIEITLTDVAGRVLSSWAARPVERLQLNVPGLSPGLYFLHIHTDEGTAVFKVGRR